MSNFTTLPGVFARGDNMITSLGFSTGENFESLAAGTIGIRRHNDPGLFPSPVMASLVGREELARRFSDMNRLNRTPLPESALTVLEKMMILSVADALRNSGIRSDDPRTLLFISTTKGNIDLLENRNKMLFSHKRVFLWEMARMIQRYFGFKIKPVIISNACISGVVAIIAASRYIRMGLCDHAVVTGGDLISEFVISGFHSFQALSPGPCRPFDINRDGLSLGEGCGTMVLSKFPPVSAEPVSVISGGAITNDANHISGPSRTGQELALAIRTALEQSHIPASGVDHVSAHGTATLFNDEMESHAISLAGLAQCPVNSLKGYFGHTLGAAGIIETVAAIESMRRNKLLRSAGFINSGLPEPLNVLTENLEAPLRCLVKTASGFGGCNAALVCMKSETPEALN